MSKEEEAIRRNVPSDCIWDEESNGPEEFKFVNTPFRYIKSAMNSYADQRVSEALNSQWVSVKERLPDVSGNVLCEAINSKGQPYVWIYHFSTIDMNFVGNDVKVITEKVLRWTKLPSPPLNH